MPVLLNPLKKIARGGRRLLNAVLSLADISRITPNQWRGLSIFLLLGVFTLLAATFTHYGITWDEGVRTVNGSNIINWYASNFTDISAIRTDLKYMEKLNFYGGFFDLISTLAANMVTALTHSYFFETRHAVNALFGFIGIAGAYKLAKTVAGPRAGFFAILSLVLTPRWYGHMFNNPKDIPFAAMFAWTLYYTLRLYDTLPRVPAHLWIKLGVFSGLTLGVRIGGAFLFGYIGLVGLMWVFSKLITRQTPFRQASDVWMPALGFLLTPVLAWGVMLVFWPFAQIAPVRNPLHALLTAGKFPWHSKIFFRGDYIDSRALPTDYLPHWFSISLPDFYFFILLGGAALIIGLLMTSVVLIIKKRNVFWADSKKIIRYGFLIAILLIAVIFPYAVVITKGSVIYDGIRHFLFVQVVLAVICGITVTGIIALVSPRALKSVFGIVLFLLMAVTVYDMIDLHPYQTVYFNRLHGGLKRCGALYETDYWGNSFKEGAAWIIHDYHPGFSRRLKVTGLFNYDQWSYFFDKQKYSIRKVNMRIFKRFNDTVPEERRDPKFHLNVFARPDVVLGTLRWDILKSFNGPVLYSVERKGVPLLQIKRVKSRTSVQHLINARAVKK